MQEIKRRVRLVRAIIDQSKMEVYHVETAQLTLMMPMLNNEVMGTLLYRCVRRVFFASIGGTMLCSTPRTASSSFGSMAYVADNAPTAAFLA